jgi:hypothetical protein
MPADQTISACPQCNQRTVRDGGRCNWCGYHASDVSVCTYCNGSGCAVCVADWCTYCNGTGCPVCKGAWPDAEDRRYVCKGCGKRRAHPVAHHSNGMLCGPWVGPHKLPPWARA